MRWWLNFYRAGQLWLRHDLDYFAAAFSYYAPLALVPLVFVSLWFTSLIYGTEVVQALFTSWGSVFGRDVLELISVAVNNLDGEIQTYRLPLFAVFLFLSVSVVSFNVLGTGFQRIWGDDRVGLVVWVQKSLRSIFFIFLLQVYLVIIVGFEGLLKFLAVPKSGLLSDLVLFMVTAILFTFLYRSLSMMRPRWSSCFQGGVVAAFLFVVAKYLVVVYLLAKPVLSIFGAAGLLLVLLVWVYVLASLVYYGAALSYLIDKDKQTAA